MKSVQEINQIKVALASYCCQNKSHRFSALKQHKCINLRFGMTEISGFLGLRRLQPRCWQGCVFLEAPGDDPFLYLFHLPRAPDILWFLVPFVFKALKLHLLFSDLILWLSLLPLSVLRPLWPWIYIGSLIYFGSTWNNPRWSPHSEGESHE